MARARGRNRPGGMPTALGGHAAEPVCHCLLASSATPAAVRTACEQAVAHEDRPRPRKAVGMPPKPHSICVRSPGDGSQLAERPPVGVVGAGLGGGAVLGRLALVRPGQDAAGDLGGRRLWPAAAAGCAAGPGRRAAGAAPRRRPPGRSRGWAAGPARAGRRPPRATRRGPAAPRPPTSRSGAGLAGSSIPSWQVRRQLAVLVQQAGASPAAARAGACGSASCRRSSADQPRRAAGGQGAGVVDAQGQGRAHGQQALLGRPAPSGRRPPPAVRRRAPRAAAGRRPGRPGRPAPAAPRGGSRPSGLGVPQQRLGRRPADHRRRVVQELGQRLGQLPVVDVGQGVDGGGPHLRLAAAAGEVRAPPPAGPCRQFWRNSSAARAATRTCGRGLPSSASAGEASTCSASRRALTSGRSRQASRSAGQSVRWASRVASSRARRSAGRPTRAGTASRRSPAGPPGASPGRGAGTRRRPVAGQPAASSGR